MLVLLVSEYDSTEGLVLRQSRGFHLLDAGFTYIEPPVEIVESAEDFIERTVGMPKLIFGDEALLQLLTNGAKPLARQILVEPNLDDIHDLDVDEIVFVSDETWMRGIDYGTAHPAGIALLLGCPCSSVRAYRQALGRVGRYGASCKRYRLAGTEKVKIEAERILLSKIAELTQPGRLTGRSRKNQDTKDVHSQQQH